jgi:hypothetical protein
MANLSSEERDVRKLNRRGSESVGLTVPIEVIRKLGWRLKQKVRVRLSGKKLIVEDWKK